MESAENQDLCIEFRVSNSTVKRELPPAHGTCIVKTPCAGQLVLGTALS